jgi:hypothetical protein
VTGHGDRVAVGLRRLQQALLRGEVDDREAGRPGVVGVQVAVNRHVGVEPHRGDVGDAGRRHRFEARGKPAGEEVVEPASAGHVRITVVGHDRDGGTHGAEHRHCRRREEGPP